MFIGIVSEELSSVETVFSESSVTSEGLVFQKNLVVWKREVQREGGDIICGVSEELSSVETSSHKVHIEHLSVGFQKNLVVWKQLMLSVKEDL